MRKVILSGLAGLFITLNLFAQHGERKQISSDERARGTVDQIAQTVTFTKQQKQDIVVIFTKFYDDVRAQQAFRDPSKMDVLEKDRDAKVAKLLNNPKTYKQYQDAVAKIKAAYQQHQHKARP